MEENIDLSNYGRKRNKMMQKNFSIFAMFLNRREAKKAIKSLKSFGYSDEDIFLFTSKSSGNHDFVYHQLTNIRMGVFIGALLGFFILGLAGFLLGLRERMQLGLSSWIIYTVVGMVIGLIFGAVSGALAGIGMPKSALKRYEFYLSEGGTILKVHLKESEESSAVNVVLEKAGGQDIVVLEESQIWSAVANKDDKPTFH